MRLTKGFLAFVTLLSISANPALTDNYLRFLYVKSTIVPGSSMIQSCRIQLKTAIYGVKPGRGGTILCRVSYEDALKKQRTNNFNN